jgi:hypothetical protein
MPALTRYGYTVHLVDGYGKDLRPVLQDQAVSVTAGSYFLVARRLGGSAGEVPDDFFLSANYPNPFNPMTTIRFGLPSAGQVRLSVFNVLGQKVIDLVDGEMLAGVHEVIWDGRNEDGQAVSSGLYFYRLETAGFSQSRKMLLIK